MFELLCYPCYGNNKNLARQQAQILHQMSKMEPSTSILSLNDDCLTAILSFLDDFSSFYSFCLICKRFKQVTLSISDWHVNVIKRRVKFYAMQFVVDEYPKETEEPFKHFVDIEELVEMVDTYDVIKPTYANILNVWRSRGPVAAKVFTWIRLSHRLIRGSIYNNLYVFKYSNPEFTFHLPSCKKDMKIEIECNNVFVHGDDEFEVAILYTYDDTRIESIYHTQQQQWRHIMYLGNETKILTTNPAIELFQKELGETTPPISGHFFLHFFVVFDEEVKYFFTNNVENEEPNPESVQPVLDRFAETKSLVKTVGESINIRTVAEMVKILKQISEGDIYLLQKEFSMFLKLLREFKEMPVQLFYSLFLRLYIPSESESTTLHFRMKNQDIMEMDLAKDQSINLTTAEIDYELDFYLPDGKHIRQILIDPDDKIFREPLENVIKRVSGFECFQPVTNILKDCITFGIEDKDIITNSFTVMFFLTIANYFP